MDLQLITEKQAVLLVDRRPESWPHCMFVTISPNPKHKHKTFRFNNNGKRTSVQIPYGKLTQFDQYHYCLRVVRSTYLYSSDTKIFGTWELNLQGNVHFHLLISDPQITNDTHLKMFQRDVLNSNLVFSNLTKGMIDYMNNIVFVNDSVKDRFKYILKDMDVNLQIYPYYAHNLPETFDHL